MKNELPIIKSGILLDFNCRRVNVINFFFFDPNKTKTHTHKQTNPIHDIFRYLSVQRLLFSKYTENIVFFWRVSDLYQVGHKLIYSARVGFVSSIETSRVSLICTSLTCYLSLLSLLFIRYYYEIKQKYYQMNCKMRFFWVYFSVFCLKGHG